MSFEPGDHLRVRRRGYFHHGIHVGDDQVVQFGGGVFDKRNASIDRFSIETFARCGAVSVVPHEDHDTGMTVRRATWLLKNPPPQSYNLVGFNCEHVARWCATGWETESLQTRGVFKAKTVVGWPLLWWMAWHARTKRPLPGRRIVIAYEAFSLWLLWQYHNEIRHFNEHIRENWPG